MILQQIKRFTLFSATAALGESHGSGSEAGTYLGVVKNFSEIL
jgi:hypothetical protein